MTSQATQARSRIPKAPTGISGLDRITNGGLPAGRTTLVSGGPGCGKTVLGVKFLVHGVTDCDAPGLLVTFEETPDDLIKNFQSMGIDLKKLIDQGKLGILHVDVSELGPVETGQYNLDALQIRLQHRLREIGAKRLLLDTMETVFSVLADTPTLRNEVGRLLRWIGSLGITTVLTGERREDSITTHGFEAYVSDCVILLNHRISDQVSKRRLRILKYRGSSHGKDEVPFLISETGFSVLPLSAVALNYEVSDERISTGVEGLDRMLGGKGLYRGSTAIITGSAGTGKSSLSATFVASVCRNGGRPLYLAFEESREQVIRNMASIGVELQKWVDEGSLRVEAFRPTHFGLEEHLVRINDLAEEIKPDVVVMDPITNFVTMGTTADVKAMLMRVFDEMKRRGITLMLTALTSGSAHPVETEADVSSLVDTWISLDWMKSGEHGFKRSLRVIKSRGMETDLTTRQLTLAADGITLGSLTAEG